MLSAPAVDLTFDDDEWTAQPITARFYSTSSTGSWGVTSIGRGFNWNKSDDDMKQSPVEGSDCAAKLDAVAAQGSSAKQPHSFHDTPKVTFTPIPLSYRLHTMPAPIFTDAPIVRSPVQSRSGSPIIITQSVGARPPCSPSSPRPRRRSSQQRISLVAGRVMIAPVEQSPLLLPQPLRRSDSSSSAISVQSTRPPSPSTENQSFLGEKRITDFIIEGEIGRGAYGLVKRAREDLKDGTVGLVIKQIIKNRILADCWKKHAKLGTIPIEIYVMSATSNTSYVLPPRRAWDPARACAKHCLTYKIERLSDDQEDWIDGKVVKGHPNICPLLDFFEDSHFYYLVLPCTTPETRLNEAPPASDLFELVESYPHGLPPGDIRTYLGQIADALSFLHSHGIVHRDVKDENVVLGSGGKCILIDFGSSGIVRKNGWDTFSGTLDYAAPEILRGERYYGKEQDVWAFGVVAYVLLVGECPFTTAGEAQDGLESPFANASITLDERCADGKERDGEETDGGGALGDAAALVRGCLRVDVAARPTLDRILQSRFLIGNGGWGLEHS